MNIVQPFFLALITTYIAFITAKGIYSNVTSPAGYLHKNRINNLDTIHYIFALDMIVLFIFLTVIFIKSNGECPSWLNINKCRIGLV